MSSSLETLLDDAERIVPSLVPTVHDLPQVVGVLIKHVEALAGDELHALTDDELGIITPAPDPNAGVTETQLAEAQAENRALAERLAALEANATPPASSEPDAGAGTDAPA